MKAKVKLLLLDDPPEVTVTLGVPTFASIVAVAPDIVAAAPGVPGVPGSPFKLVKAKAKLLLFDVPPGVTVTPGVPTVLFTVAVAPDIVAAAPFVPGAPFKFLKSKANVLALAEPPEVTVTLGVPTFASIVAVAPVIVAFVPSVPFVPGAPFRLVNAKAKLLLLDVPPKVTVTPGVPTVLLTVAVAPDIVAFVPAAPVAPLGITKLNVLS